MCKKGCNRFDAAGHRILPHADMALYYKDDPKSLEIVRRNMPHRYVIIPIIEILFDAKKPGCVDVYKVYPGETILLQKELSLMAVDGLRRAYKGLGGWTVKYNKMGIICLRREGRVILDPRKRYGTWN